MSAGADGDGFPRKRGSDEKLFPKKSAGEDRQLENDDLDAYIYGLILQRKYQQILDCLLSKDEQTIVNFISGYEQIKNRSVFILHISFLNSTSGILKLHY